MMINFDSTLENEDDETVTMYECKVCGNIYDHKIASCDLCDQTEFHIFEATKHGTPIDEKDLQAELERGTLFEQIYHIGGLE